MNAQLQRQFAGIIGSRGAVAFGHGHHALESANGGLAVDVEQCLAERSNGRLGPSGAGQKLLGRQRGSLGMIVIVNAMRAARLAQMLAR